MPYYRWYAYGCPGVASAPTLSSAEAEALRFAHGLEQALPQDLGGGVLGEQEELEAGVGGGEAVIPRAVLLHLGLEPG